LLGSAEMLREAIGTPLPPVDRHELDRLVAAVRAALSAPPADAAWQAGRAMALDQAVAFAAEDPDALPPVRKPTWEEGLTPREREVIRLLVRGLSNREIARALVVADRTAEAHVNHVLTKLGLRSRAQVIAWAVEHGVAGPTTSEN
jgi:DNA-binding NarL/FixJ family response regulator